MTFITSRDTIETLMGPSVRTQTSQPAVSPRQKRLRAAGIRSASEPNLSIFADQCTASQSSPLQLATAQLPTQSRASPDRRSTTSNIHPQTQFQAQQHLANFPPISSLHSTSGQPRRRSFRQSLYNSSIDLGSRSNLAPVIEIESSPVEEKTLAQSINFSLPKSRSVSPSSGLGISIPEAPTSLLATGDTSSLNLAIPLSCVDRDQITPRPAMYLSRTAASSCSTLSSLEDNIDYNSALSATAKSNHTLQNIDLNLTPKVVPIYGTASMSFDALNLDLLRISDEAHSMHQGSQSSPELACWSSFSSREDNVSRSSMSSVESVEGCSDASADEAGRTEDEIMAIERRKVSEAYAAHSSMNTPRSPTLLSPAPHKSSPKLQQLLGPGSPQSASFDFDASTTAPSQFRARPNKKSGASVDPTIAAVCPVPVLKKKSSSGLLKFVTPAWARN